MAIHHAYLPITDLDRSREFYGGLLGLEEMPRPTLEYPGLWYRVGTAQELHLAVFPHATLRTEKPLYDHDYHFAIRIKSLRPALDLLHSRGYHEAADEMDPKKLIVRTHSLRKFAQIFLLDPDRNIIELNSEVLE